ARRCPQRGGIGRRSHHRGHAASRPLAPTAGSQRIRTERQPVAALNRENACELFAMLPEGSKSHRAHSVGLGAIYRSSPGVHRAAYGGIVDDRNVEGAPGEDDRVADPVPIPNRTVAEVHVNLLDVIRVEAELWIANVESRLTAVAPDCLLEELRRVSRLPGAVVLRTALHQAGVERADGDAVELKRIQPQVQTLQLSRNAGEQLLAAGKNAAGDAARIAVRGDVGKCAAGAHEAAVVTLEELIRIGRV